MLLGVVMVLLGVAMGLFGVGVCGGCVWWGVWWGWVMVCVVGLLWGCWGLL